MSTKSVGKGVELSVEGTILTIKVDLATNHGLSGSGKSLTVATTNGNVECPDHPDVKIGLNVYRPTSKH